MKFKTIKIKSFYILFIFLLVLGFLLGSYEQIYKQGAKKVTTYNPQMEQKEENKTYIEIIWDASGSMWGKENGLRKIFRSKNILTSLNSKIPKNIYIGLRVFGARRIGDENDSFLAVSFDKNNHKKIENYIKNIKPLGKSPIELSLNKACKDLENTNGDRHILLISDGISNKEISKNNITEKLNNLNIKFHIVHVGNIKNQKIVNELIDMAKNSGGEYFSYKNSQSVLNIFNN